MNIQDILKTVDHTLLNPAATWEEIRLLCQEGMEYKTASVCIPASYVKEAKEYVRDELKICTVIGFPNGYDTTASKIFQAKDAIQNGADEVDMVIQIGWVKDGRYDHVQEEIARIKEACGQRILKVIVETCLLTEEEKIRMCQVVSRSGADFIKTSTGFSSGGATLEDIRLFAQWVSPGVRIKAAGGIASLEDAKAFLEAGASRLGTSRIVKLVQQGAKLL